MRADAARAEKRARLREKAEAERTRRDADAGETSKDETKATGVAASASGSAMGAAAAAAACAAIGAGVGVWASRRGFRTVLRRYVRDVLRTVAHLANRSDDHRSEPAESPPEKRLPESPPEKRLPEKRLPESSPESPPVSPATVVANAASHAEAALAAAEAAAASTPAVAPYKKYKDEERVDDGDRTDVGEEPTMEEYDEAKTPIATTPIATTPTATTPTATTPTPASSSTPRASRAPARVDATIASVVTPRRTDAGDRTDVGEEPTMEEYDLAIVKLEGRRQSLFEEYARLERSEGRDARTEDFRLLAGSGSGSTSGFASGGNPRVNGGGGVASLDPPRQSARPAFVPKLSLAGLGGGGTEAHTESRGGADASGAAGRATDRTADYRTVDNRTADEPSSGGSSIERVAAEMEALRDGGARGVVSASVRLPDPAAEEKATIERLHRECAVIEGRLKFRHDERRRRLADAEAKEETNRRARLAKATRHLSISLKRRALLGWVLELDAAQRRRRLLRKATTRARLRTTSRAFETWLEFRRLRAEARAERRLRELEARAAAAAEAEAEARRAKEEAAEAAAKAAALVAEAEEREARARDEAAQLRAEAGAGAADKTKHAPAGLE